MHFVYILLCVDGTLYTGYTIDVDRRVREHNGGSGSKYTRSRLPVVLVYVEKAPSRGSALAREAAIKKLPRLAKTRLISENGKLTRHSRR